MSTVEQLTLRDIFLKVSEHKCKNRTISTIEKKAMKVNIKKCGAAAVFDPGFNLCTLLQSDASAFLDDNMLLILHLLKLSDCPDLEYSRRRLRRITHGVLNAPPPGLTMKPLMTLDTSSDSSLNEIPIKQPKVLKMKIRPTPITLSSSSDTSDSPHDPIPIQKQKVLKMKIRSTKITVRSSSDSSDLSLDAIPNQKQKVLKRKTSIAPPPKIAKVTPESRQEKTESRPNSWALNRWLEDDECDEEHS